MTDQEIDRQLTQLANRIVGLLLDDPDVRTIIAKDTALDQIQLPLNNTQAA